MRRGSQRRDDWKTKIKRGDVWIRTKVTESRASGAWTIIPTSYPNSTSFSYLILKLNATATMIRESTCHYCTITTQCSLCGASSRISVLDTLMVILKSVVCPPTHPSKIPRVSLQILQFELWIFRAIILCRIPLNIGGSRQICI